jgi:hypothetical protein
VEPWTSVERRRGDLAVILVRVVQCPGQSRGFVAGIVFDDLGRVMQAAPILRRYRNASQLSAAARAYGWSLEHGP